MFTAVKKTSENIRLYCTIMCRAEINKKLVYGNKWKASLKMFFCRHWKSK